MDQNLEYVIRHVFLPPKLPDKDDSCDKYDRVLTQLVKDALELAATISGDYCSPSLCTMMDVMLQGDGGGISTNALDQGLTSMKDRDVIVLQIRSQNAGLIVRKSRHEYTFESFELSSLTDAVIAAKGRLRCTYPGPAISVAEDRVLDPTFREAIVELISQLDSQVLEEACPTTRKARNEVVEIRQTIHPKYVTEMLMGILRGVGYPQEVERISKCIRDEVLWDSTLLPWRRSPRWVLLRVALQTTFLTKKGNNQVHVHYKFFMLLLMAQILERALDASTPSDLLFIMTAKISRRMTKLGDSAEDMPWLRLVQNTVNSTQRELTRRWNKIQENPDPVGCSPAPNLAELRSDSSDTCLSLRALRKYHKEMQERNLQLSDPPYRISPCTERIQQDPSVLPTRQTLEMLAKSDSILWLVDLELWVQDHLRTWLVTILQQPSKKDCSSLAAAIAIYHKAAKEAYVGDPERFSFMAITIMDLWVALDKCATSQEPLLLAYDTGFPKSLFDPLLLPKKEGMIRLFQIEEHLGQRRRRATSGNPSIFGGANKPNSFAVQYFDQSDVHQHLRRDIERAATSVRDRKKAELSTKKNEYQRLVQQSNSKSCSFIKVIRGKKRNLMEVTEHSPNCEKCALMKRARAMKISIHEWPLPTNDLEARVAVFEIHVPDVIWVWREITYEMLVDGFTPSFETPKGPLDKYTLHAFSGIKNWLESRTGRLQLASPQKEFSRAHYSNQSVSVAVEESICVNNGLRCQYYDSDCYMWTSDTLGMHSLASRCILKLPTGSYKSLQWALNSTNHTSNEILAKQDKCPESLTLHEFYSFASLRSGHRLQWRNIAREIVSRILNFSHEETSLLMMQAAWQVGPSQDTHFRQSHIDLDEEEFGLFLLDALNEALSNFESNWQGAFAIRTFSILATRLLSLSPHKSVETRAFKFLERVRIITLRWTREVVHLMHEMETEEELKSLGIRAVELALTCYETFDVGLGHLSAMLTMGENASILIECLITIRDRCPSSHQDVTRSLGILLERFFRRCVFTETTLRAYILSNPAVIDLAIQQLWVAYRPGRGWTALKGPNTRWVTTQTFVKGNGLAMDVHLNLLSGNLLVDGSPLSRLPQNYESHPTYQRLFGQRVLEVVPSTSIEMAFESRRPIFGQQVHFRLFDGELIIRTCKDGSMHELLPLRAVDGDFPRSFVKEYTHWFDSAYGTIEWRPLTNPWVSSVSNWRTWPHGDQNFSLGRNPTKLIDIRTPIAEAISKILSPLEHARHLHIMFNFDKSIIEVHLPRLNLDFFMREKSSLLESKQFRAMAVDTNQSFGSLSGLRNKLILSDVSGTSRIVIVPDGKIIFDQDRPDDHVEVSIDTRRSKQVSYHQFQIDSQLGRLVDNGSLHSRLFRVYLHALTSYCLPDSLTGRTGTEEALYSLSLSSTQSFLTLGHKEVGLLENIDALSPKRKYYPKHLKTMQTVVWNKLSPLSHHERFFQAVQNIVRQADSLQISQSTSAVSKLVEPRKFVELHERAAIRNSGIQTHGFGAEDFTARYDKLYRLKDRIPEPTRELRTCTTAKMVDDWAPNTKVRLNLLHEIESWDSAVAGTAFHGEVVLGFNTEWLRPPSELFPAYWCALHRKLSATDPLKDKYRVMIFLSTLTYSVNADLDLIQILLAFATVPELRQITMPNYANFLQLTLIVQIPGYLPNRQLLTRHFNEHAKPFERCPESRIARLPGEPRAEATRSHRHQYKLAVDTRVKVCVDHLMNLWPTGNVSVPEYNDLATYIHITEAMIEVRNLFHHWHCNSEFENYIRRIQAVVERSSEYPTPDSFRMTAPIPSYHAIKGYVTFEDLLAKPAPAQERRHDCAQDVQDLILFTSQPALSEISRSSLAHDTNKLVHLLGHLTQRASGTYEKTYINDLESSHDAFRQSTVHPYVTMEAVQPLLQRYLNETRLHVDEIYQAILFHLQLPVNSSHELCSRASMSPRLSPSIILSYLAQSLRTMLSDDWKAVIVQFGLAITSLQRAERLIACAGNRAELLSELSNPGHLAWNPMEFPDWLLLELENNILIRSEQAQIAMQMINPVSGLNSIMQLNMGLGKSSVIVPIVAATLADGENLARVVVLKSLATQMFQLLLKKLGGLINRKIFFLPISRSLTLNVEAANRIREIYENCTRIGGVLLVQPEHLLSFELLGLDQALALRLDGEGPTKSSEAGVGQIMVDTQRWLLKHSRDILDESDEILSVRFELIYTMGAQRTTEFSPDRWVIIERVLEILGKIAREMTITGLFPNGLEVLPAKAGDFPRIRILRPEVGMELLSRVVRHVCENGFPGLSLWNLPTQARAILFRFLTDPTITEVEVQPLQDSSLGIESMKLGLLLLRGLFAGGILVFAFAQKRWRVNYGLDLSRTKLAVPYHAKDSPATRAEFSHPDTAIILTCLSYYYGGLSDEQLRACFEELFQSDHAQEEYEEWTRSNPDLPNVFRQLSGINLTNEAQCSRDLFPFLKFSKAAIDFYMSHLVFPKEMKEFSHKLSSSGWEIGRDKQHPMTGFSGTNDSKYVLPVAVKQRDLPQQLHTNAAVLDCLLRPENTIDAKFTSGVEIIDAEVLLQMAIKSDPPIRVILDVGAQILELRNEEVAQKWLALVSPSDAQAAIYFDEQNELFVLGRSGLKEPLLVSPYAKQMDKCLVYLDEAHTRGTDLKMPSDYRAIVTLGPDLTKDRLAQACMRMRKLGKGQSVVFCASVEVQLKILQSNGKSVSDIIMVADVLSWCIQNTWTHTRKSIPLWATQGVRHYRRRAACSTSSGLPDVPESILEEEAQSLQQRYGFGSQQSEERMIFQNDGNDQLLLFKGEIEAIREKCREFGLNAFNDSSIHEEQERELQPENEREQQVERPPSLHPCHPTVHANVIELMSDGLLNRFSAAFQPAFWTFTKTSASKAFEAGAWPQDLLVTSDFARTVQQADNEPVDQYLRPVHWIVSVRYGNNISCIIISPHEANELMPLVRGNRKVTLHVYTPRLSLSNYSLEELAFCAIPAVSNTWVAPSLVPQINLFAGQLYLRDVWEYFALCRFLGLCYKPPPEGVIIAVDGFVNAADRWVIDHCMSRYCRFTQSPVTFLRIVMGLRRKGQSFNSSHLGRILNGELLKEEHFIIQGRPAVAGRITDGHEMFEVKSFIEVVEVKDEASAVKQEGGEVVKMEDDEVEMVGGRGWMVDQKGVIVLDN